MTMLQPLSLVPHASSSSTLFLLLLLLLLPNLLFSPSVSAIPQLSSSPLVPGSILPPAFTDSVDNGFSAPPAAGLGTPLVQTNNPRPLGGASLPSSPSATGGGNGPTLPPLNSLPGGGALPPPLTAPQQPGGPSVPLLPPKAPTLSGNGTLGVPLPNANGTQPPPRNATLENIAPGTIHTNASRASSSSSSSSPPDAGLGGLVTAGIVVASVVLASMIGIFLFRKWKLRPKERSGRWRTASNAQWPGQGTAAASSLPLHHAMQQHHQHPGYYGSADGGSTGRATPPVQMYQQQYQQQQQTAGYPVGYSAPAESLPQGEALWQPPVHTRTVEMDLALRHHLRNG